MARKKVRTWVRPTFGSGAEYSLRSRTRHQGYGNLMLSPEQQAAFVEEQPEVFLPVAGGWGRMGATHIRLAAANEDVLAGALHTAWKLRVEKNGKAGKTKRTSTGVSRPQRARKRELRLVSLGFGGFPPVSIRDAVRRSALEPGPVRAAVSPQYRQWDRTPSQSFPCTPTATACDRC